MITARLANSNVSDAQPMTFVADKASGCRSTNIESGNHWEWRG
ncbi:hypothetical protein ACLB1R_05860 [Escherichia coli]